MRVRVANVVFDAPAPSLDEYGRNTRAIAQVYAELLGLDVTTRADHFRSLGYPADEGDARDHLVLAADGPSIAFEPVHGAYAPVRWPDPDHPAQIHLDVAVPDLEDAHRRVQQHGAELLLEADDHRTYADAVGHPFCLYPGAAGPHGRIRRIVFDCSSPRSLASFYRSFTRAAETLVDTSEWVEIGSSDGSDPTLAFRHVPHTPPRWPDPTRPQQLHIDYGFDGDSAAFGDEVVALGAMRLPYMGGGFVYADPAGHPFCLGE